MGRLSPETLWKLPAEQLLSFIREELLPQRPREVHFYAPSFTFYQNKYFRSRPTAFPSISVTGPFCALKCKHCEGRVLRTMHPAPSPAKLFDLCSRLKEKGAVGCLISGGCLPNGSVPLRRFIGAIARIKRELGLTVVVHTGLIDGLTARRLKEAGVDAALIDVIGSDETIRDVYRLRRGVEDYKAALRALHDSGIPFVPHILVGLHYGRLLGELQALRMIAKYSPSAVIVIALIPIPGTRMEGVKPPSPLDVARVMAIARVMMPKTPLALGCMRPPGRHRVETDRLAIEVGVEGIAFPTEEAVELARSLGLRVSFSHLCCSQVFSERCL